MSVYLIAAVGPGGQIGLNNTLPWHDAEDLRFFRFMTMGQVCLFGWKTAHALPELDGRIIRIDDTSQRPEQVIAEIEREYERDIYICGGAKTYARYRHLIRRSFITHIKYEGVADTFMPALW
ncbi:MAG: hypothetical protein EOP83_05375 [Verrucomicrobiaceae bacterium]|nr:MAG: hypothetical protein EOP83_05375 [Verrucomicrobiaceae bacterium]